MDKKEIDSECDRALHFLSENSLFWRKTNKKERRHFRFSWNIQFRIRDERIMTHFAAEPATGYPDAKSSLFAHTNV